MWRNGRNYEDSLSTIPGGWNVAQTVLKRSLGYGLRDFSTTQCVKRTPRTKRVVPRVCDRSSWLIWKWRSNPYERSFYERIPEVGGRAPFETTEVRSACWRLLSAIARPSFMQIDCWKTLGWIVSEEKLRLLMSCFISVCYDGGISMIEHTCVKGLIRDMSWEGLRIITYLTMKRYIIK